MERAAFREKQIHKDTEVQICPIRLVLTCSELSCAPHAEFLCQNTGLFSSPINATASTFREACFHPVDFRNRRFLSLSDAEWMPYILSPLVTWWFEWALLSLLLFYVTQNGILITGPGAPPPSPVQRYHLRRENFLKPLPIKFGLIT